MWIPPQTSVPPLRNARKRQRHQGADGCEDDCSVELRRRELIAVAGPVSAQLRCELLCVDVARSCERVNLLAMPACDLRDDVCGGSEAVDA